MEIERGDNRNAGLYTKEGKKGREKGRNRLERVKRL